MYVKAEIVYIAYIIIIDLPKLYDIVMLTELKDIIPKALSLDKMVILAVFGVPTVTPFDELWNDNNDVGYTVWKSSKNREKVIDIEHGTDSVQ